MKFTSVGRVYLAESMERNRGNDCNAKYSLQYIWMFKSCCFKNRCLYNKHGDFWVHLNSCYKLGRGKLCARHFLLKLLCNVELLRNLVKCNIET